MTKEERIEYIRKWQAEHKEKVREYKRKWRAEHKARMKKWIAEDLNKNGVTKNHIRLSSSRILVKCHAKLSGYEIHHCFGYENPNKFIYIPRSLHLQIHQLLRDNKIPADTDHWFAIRDLVNSCEEYTYIRA